MVPRWPLDILVVDDERDFVQMLSLRLTDIGHRVEAAYDGREALSVLEQADIEPDVVILDIRMPVMDGVSVLKEIKKQFPLVEVILLTGHGAVDTAVAGLKAGAFDYVLKPAVFEELLEKLEAARQRRRQQEERILRAEARALMRRCGDI
jgi:DNA-binding NtrC family response regulator